MSSTPLHRARLLHDLHELTKNPYPYITLHSHPTITTACLILTPPGLPPIHLTATFPPRYPTSPPVISIQTYSPHPNVFGDYICASILNTSEGYTPAYTLKGIAIQLLSFFNSENVQQQYDGRVVDLKAYRERREGRRGGPERDGYKCKVCGFPNFAGLGEKLGEVSLGDTRDTGIQVPENTPTPTPSATYKPTATLASLPPEILIRICDFLESEQLVLLMRAWEAIGGADGVVTTYGLIRKRELQCFATKEGFGSEALGVGVRVWGRGNVRTIESEFDLLSETAFKKFSIRTSVQGIEFEHWLPLPLSRRHWAMVKEGVHDKMSRIATSACLVSTPTLSSASAASVLFAFMNDVVVKLSAHANASPTAATPVYTGGYSFQSAAISSLEHASEKAIESYYHLFHLLCCVASSGNLIATINGILTRFLVGQTDKTAVPNLGHLLTMLLISDFDLDHELTMAILKEAITRNVVWMLDAKGANMPELSYMESDVISKYRLKKTYQASRTSYRLLMFAELFRRSVNRGSGESRKSVVQLRDEMFDKLGAPPSGAAKKLADEMKWLEKVEDFPNFLETMGVSKERMPKASQFTTLLRECCEESVRKGYSIWKLSQDQALGLRRTEGKEPHVGVRKVEDRKAAWRGIGGAGFFPGKKREMLRTPRGFSSPNDWR